MEQEEKSKLGGRISAQRSRAEALANYYSNPNYCANCGKLIEVDKGIKPADTRKRKTCSSECFREKAW